MSFQRVALKDFYNHFIGECFTITNRPLSYSAISLSELSSVALGGKVISVSDEFFAEAYHLLLVEVGHVFSILC